ncbi:MAG: hypothetical protein SO016_08420 [Lachnospiraceae bacterium]|nr:hypothetical protein [Lachnospiraceae bacterium]
MLKKQELINSRMQELKLLNIQYLQEFYHRELIITEVQNLGADGSALSYTLFVYCMNNPVNHFDAKGNWSLPNWAKVVVGAVATVDAVTVTVATGDAAASVLIGVAASTVGGAVISASKHLVTTGSLDGLGKTALDGAADGFIM